jgi:hypothetical protein
VGRFIAYIVFLLVGSFAATAQRVSTLRTLPDALKENSGLAFYPNSILYFINDGGNAPLLHRYDTVNNDYSTLTVLNASNADWEDLAQDTEGNLYIGDIGNNSNNRKNLKIYKSVNPETIASNEITVDTISYTYSNQTTFPPESDSLNFDCEAMLWYKDSIYLFTKNRTSPYDGWCYMYVLPDEPGEYVAQLRDSVQFTAMSKEAGWITGADIRNDSLVLLTSGKVHLAPAFNSAPLGSLSWTTYDVGFSQKEAIVFGASSDKIFISDELFIIGNKLYLLDLAKTNASLDYLFSPGFKVKQTSTTLHIKLQKRANAQLYIYSIMGVKMYDVPFEKELFISQEDLAAGNYIIQLFVAGENYSFRWAKSE